MVDLNGKGAFDYAHVVIPGLSTMPNGIAWFGGALYIASLEKYQNCRVRSKGRARALWRSRRPPASHPSAALPSLTCPIAPHSLPSQLYKLPNADSFALEKRVATLADLVLLRGEWMMGQGLDTTQCSTWAVPLPPSSRSAHACLPALPACRRPPHRLLARLEARPVSASSLHLATAPLLLLRACMVPALLGHTQPHQPACLPRSLPPPPCRFGPDGKLYVPIGANCNICRLDGSPPNNGYDAAGNLLYNTTASGDPYHVTAPYQKTPASPVFEFGRCGHGPPAACPDQPPAALRMPSSARQPLAAAAHSSLPPQPLTTPRPMLIDAAASTASTPTDPTPS